ncbi:titin homolog [Malaya genurostris]|uniref:titin homolog n=1 Tax=Malaya genurostris TaxID=325434 RepID=UPI0026F3A0C5|nr:titin homolog [Malaya genurostris]
MKTKKQLAAAAAAAAAAAEKKAANASASDVPLKKPLKRLQTKTKESTPKLVEFSVPPGQAQQSKQSQPGTVRGKTVTKPTVGPKSPVPTKPEPATPSSKVSATSSGSTKQNKPTKHESALNPVSPAGTSAKSSGLASPKRTGSLKKADPAKSKNSTPTGSGVKKPSAGEKKKIQKELKNLGITDRTINQLDTTVVECNPSISEMVKTKSRATVSQQKYNEIGLLGGPTGAGGTTHKAATVAANSAKPDGSPALTGNDTNKPSEAVSTVAPGLVSTVANRKKTPSGSQKTKDHPTAAKEDPKLRETTVDRGEGAKNKSPAMTLPTPAPLPLAAKEDVKVPTGAKTVPDSKTKAKKTESNDDDNDNGTAENKPVKRNTSASSSAVSTPAVPKAKPRSKKAILEEKRAAEAKAAAAAVVAAAEVSTAGTVEPAPGSAVKQAEAEDKQKAEEEKTCSLVELEPDDRHEAEVQSRIEDIVKALEEEEANEGQGATVVAHPKADEIKIEPRVDPEQSAKEKKQTKVMKPKSSKSVPKKPRKTPTKKQPNDEMPGSNVETLNESISSANDTSAVGMTEKQLAPSSPAGDPGKSSPAKSVTVKTVANSTAKRKYVRKPKNLSASIKVTGPNDVPDPTVSSAVSQETSQKDASAKTEQQKQQIAPPIAHNSSSQPSEPTESPEPPKTIRSSTENDDDVPLNRLKNITKPDPVSTSELFIAPPKPLVVPPEPMSSGSSNPATPLLASLLSQPAVKSKRKYARKTPVAPGPAAPGKKLPPKRSPETPKEPRDKKSEKKDVYDFDDSESDIDTPVKAGKPTFKRKPLESSSSLKDDDEFEEAQPLDVKAAEEENNLSPVKHEKKIDSEQEKELPKSPKKSLSKSEEKSKSLEASHSKPGLSESEHSKDDNDDDNDEDDDDDEEEEEESDQRCRVPISRKVKQEVRDSSDDDSDGYSSEESVRTRIVKKRLTAKTRHLKLYGFWSGPKRHRVASLNAIAKVHCLYENETRAALEASLMKQIPSKVSRAVAAKVVKKEKLEDEDKKNEASAVAKEDKKDDKSDKKMSAHEKKEKEDEKKSKTVQVKEEKKKAVKMVEIKDDKKKESKKSEAKETKKDSKKKEKEKPKEESSSESDEDESEEEVVTRTLRCVPGLRGVGKHWDPNASSMESEDDLLPDSDETYAQGKDTDPVKKRKIKRKIVKKPKPKPKSEKSDKSEKPDKPKPPAKKIKKELKALMSDSEKQAEEDSCSSSSGSEKVVTAKSKQTDSKKRKRKPKEKKEVVEVLAKKRMASLNATAMLAATYEVQRILYRNTDSDSDNPAHKPKTKKAKDQKETKEKEAAKSEEKKDAKESKESKHEEKPAEAIEPIKSPEIDKSKEKEEPKEKGKENTITVKTELLRDRKDETEVKRELEEPRPMSSNVVIAQDTEVTITGVYVNSSLGANQEAYCKMQYRVQQSVTEERLVRPGEAPPRSYTPLTALSSMRPPNDQALSTPPLFGPPSQCDSPLGLGPPRSFYPPPTSSSGSSSAFCAPIPHDSPGYYQPAGPLISPHLLPQPAPGPPSATSQHSASSSAVTKQPPESDSPLQSLTQPPSSSTADSTDSDVLLTGGDLSARSQAYRYGPSGPPNIYQRPVQMHCPPPPHLAPNYYAAPPYSQYPPEMYYTHAYPPAHFYPKFAQYYPSRRYYPGPPGPGEHLYEQAPPPSSGPVPPPSGAQLVPAGPQGPQHLDHYPGPPPYPYPGYGSPGPGPGGQCYSRNLQPPPYMDAHYTTNCPCPMQSCPKNVNAGSLIGIKASKGPVATVPTPNHHIATTGAYSAVQTSTMNSSEPIMISSGSSTSSSPPSLDIHAPIVCPAEVATSSIYVAPTTTTMTTTATSATTQVSAAYSSTATACNTNITTTTITSNNTTVVTEPNRTPKVKPESDLYQCSKNYHLHHHHYHQDQRPSAPPPTHPLQHFDPGTTPLLAEVKEEPSTPTPESEFKSAKNIPKLIPITAAMVKQEIAEVKQELSTVVTCKKEDFEENGPAMTPDLLLDEALIKKEELVSELLLPDRCFVQNQKLDNKCLLSNILTTEANLINHKTSAGDICSSEKNSVSNSNNNNNNSSISNEKVQLVDSVLPEIPASTVKRRPLLVACKKTTPKKSPPNSYKNLIKRTNLDEESTITVLSDDDEEEDEEEAVIQKVVRRKLLATTRPRKVLKRTRRIFGAEQQRHLRKLSRTLSKSKRIRKITKRPSCVPSNPKIEVPTTQQTEPKLPETVPVSEDSRNGTKQIEMDSKPEEPERQARPMSNVDLTIDLVAKGYFSEPEILSQETKATSRKIKKLKQLEGRSQSEQTRSKREHSSENKHSSKKAKKLDALDVDFDKRKGKCKAKTIHADVLDAPAPSITVVVSTDKELKKASKAVEKDKKSKKGSKYNSKKKSGKKSKKLDREEREAHTMPDPTKDDQPQPHPIPTPMCPDEVDPSVDDRETDFDDAATMLVEDDMMSVDTNTMINRHNNNNSSTVENKNAVGVEDPMEIPLAPTTVAVHGCDQNPQALPNEDEDEEEDDEEEEEEIMLARRFAKKNAKALRRAARSRSKSKSRKFSIKKRHRIYRMTAEVEEVIVPRKCNSAPRWSNGWTWEGQPFQGKVFLNSDDPPVLRTCYPAMRHSEGDIIRPRDCVLLRAGSKRAELPYVAKVAYLWENPEDGEMMMSLLWYYRPEHTEQGRQPTDGPDEVFASRHKDHNSVACIEDKCYVLTFSEYCRFRRHLKGYEENIVEQPSIVPALRRENARLPPPIVSPELVMYCQRVYEFRLKRLLKTPS